MHLFTCAFGGNHVGNLDLVTIEKMPDSMDTALDTWAATVPGAVPRTSGAGVTDVFPTPPRLLSTQPIPPSTDDHNESWRVVFGANPAQVRLLLVPVWAKPAGALIEGQICIFRAWDWGGGRHAVAGQAMGKEQGANPAAVPNCPEPVSSTRDGVSAPLPKSILYPSSVCLPVHLVAQIALLPWFTCSLGHDFMTCMTSFRL